MSAAEPADAARLMMTMMRREPQAPQIVLNAMLERIGARRPAFFLDYDGTVTPIVSRPELATLAPEMKRVIERLANVAPVAVISGRDRANVASMVGVEDMVYAGSHGFDIAGPGGLDLQHEQGRRCLPALDAAERELRRITDSIDGALTERKRYAIAAHYRNVAPSDVPAIERAVDEAQRRHPELRKTGGKKIFELRPNVEWDKGKAVLWLLEALDLDWPEIAPIYIGDDETDEDAFCALAKVGGVGVLVAEEPVATHASFILQDVESVERLLTEFAERLENERRS